jgi:hypothetical protein
MSRFFKTVLLTGLFVGTTDLVSAYLTQFIKTGHFPDKMLNYMAGAGIGLESSMQGGNAAAFLGLFFHYFIAFAYTLFFFWIFPKIKFLSFNKYLVGMLYAVFVYLTMNQGILRLTRLQAWDFSLPIAYIDWVILGVIFGIPIAYNAYKYYGLD